MCFPPRIPVDCIAINQSSEHAQFTRQETTRPANKPYAGTRLTAFLQKRILELRSIKTQAEIANETGFINPNMLSIVKTGSNRLPIDRVPALARALNTEPRHLLQLALEQWVGGTAARTFDEIFGTIVTLNEIAWLNEIRDASGHSDPTMTTRARAALRAIFGK